MDALQDFARRVKTRAQTVVRAVGNHPMMMVVWFLVGVICAAISPWFMMTTNKHDDGSGGGGGFAANKRNIHHYRASFYGVTTAVFFYTLGACLKNTPLLRVRGDWSRALCCNFFVTLVTIAVTMEHKISESDVAAQMLVSVSVFSLMEISRPTFDYGILQLFLRLPIQSAAACLYNEKGRCVIGWAMGVVTVVSYMGLSTWSSFCLNCFEEELKKKKEDEEKRMKMADHVAEPPAAEVRLGPFTEIGEGSTPPVREVRVQVPPELPNDD